MNDIYQQIWNGDEHRLTVSPRSDRDWLDPEADILLDEQIQAFGRRDLDLAKKPLFQRVNEAKIQAVPTYRSLIELLDNYRFNNRQSEIITKAEKAEIEQFIKDICQTKPIEIAKNYINRQFNFKFSNRSFKQNLKSIWFDLYTNYYGNSIVRDASGFEHIFVGEGKYRTTSDEKIFGAISGYHNWLKFYFDEKQKVNYLGYSYDLKGVIGQENPYVVSAQIRWQDSLKGNVTVELFKKRGCFFVGTSPECEIAMATVAYYESLFNYKFVAEKRRTVINDAIYDLMLYRNTEQDGSRGNYIRSFYPIYLGNNKD